MAVYSVVTMANIGIAATAGKPVAGKKGNYILLNLTESVALFV